MKLRPEDKSLSQGSLDNMSVTEMRILLRKYNAGRNRAELNCQFKEWIINKEAKFTKKISNFDEVGNHHKVKLVYYGMVFTILENAGCYLKGKSSNPIGITRNRYCIELKLEDRLKSRNVRKAIANGIYSHNYMLAIAERENGEKHPGYDLLKKLEPIFTEISDELKEKFIN